MHFDDTLDAKGQAHPYPLLNTKKAIGRVKSGQTLRIDATDPASIQDVSGWCPRSGHTYLGEKQEDGYFSMFVRKG